MTRHLADLARKFLQQGKAPDAVGYAGVPAGLGYPGTPAADGYIYDIPHKPGYQYFRATMGVEQEIGEAVIGGVARDPNQKVEFQKMSGALVALDPSALGAVAGKGKNAGLQWLPPHTHDAAELTYTPDDAGDWLTPPDFIAEALDALAVQAAQVAAATSANTPSTIMKRDGSGNVAVNEVVEAGTSTVTSGGTTALTVASTPYQFFTGSATQDITTPDATTLALGHRFRIYNNSTGTLTLKTYTGLLLNTILPSQWFEVLCTGIGTADGSFTGTGSARFEPLTNKTIDGSLNTVQLARSNSSVSNPPLPSELTGIWATPVEGFKALVNSGGAGTYCWEVAYMGAGWRWTLLHNSLATVTLNTPADGAYQATTPTLAWLAAAGAVLYEVQLASDSGFSGIVDSDAAVAAPTVSKAFSPAADDRLYWRVRAKAGDDNGVWSAVRSFYQSDLFSNLIAAWSLDESSAGSSPVNRIGLISGLVMVDTNNAPSATGKIGNGVNVNGAMQLQCSSSAALQTGNVDFGAEVWIKFTALPGAISLIFGKSSSFGSGASHEWGIGVNASNKFIFRISNGTITTLTDTTVLATGTWYQVIVKHDAAADVISIIVNNATPITASYSGGGQAISAPLRLGGSGVAGQYVNGVIDMPRFWKEVLTSTKITKLNNGGAALAVPFVS